MKSYVSPKKKNSYITFYMTDVTDNPKKGKRKKKRKTCGQQNIRARNLYNWRRKRLNRPNLL